MKKIGYLIIVVLVGCSQNSNSIREIGDEGAIEVAQEHQIDEIPKNKMAEKIYKDYDINNLPKEWIRLTETDSGKVIFNSCDGGNKLISIIRETDNYKLLIHGQQEDSRYIIAKTITSDTNNIHLEVKLSHQSESELFNLQWLNLGKGIAIWETTYLPGYDPIQEIFVTSEHKSNFLSVKQPCIECWSKEQCDDWELMVE